MVWPSLFYTSVHRFTEQKRSRDGRFFVGKNARKTLFGSAKIDCEKPLRVTRAITTHRTTRVRRLPSRFPLSPSLPSRPSCPFDHCDVVTNFVSVPRGRFSLRNGNFRRAQRRTRCIRFVVDIATDVITIGRYVRLGH